MAMAMAEAQESSSALLLQTLLVLSEHRWLEVRLDLQMHAILRFQVYAIDAYLRAASIRSVSSTPSRSSVTRSTTRCASPSSDDEQSMRMAFRHICASSASSALACVCAFLHLVDADGWSSTASVATGSSARTSRRSYPTRLCMRPLRSRTCGYSLLSLSLAIAFALLV